MKNNAKNGNSSKGDLNSSNSRLRLANIKRKQKRKLNPV